MPLDEEILGFSNRWYRQALLTAELVELGPGQTIRLITAPYFLATKLEAFHERGRGDYLGSHDLEDFITVVDGRNSLTAEVAGASEEIRLFIAEQLLLMLEERRFVDSLPGHLAPDEASQERLPIVIDRLKHLATRAKIQ